MKKRNKNKSVVTIIIIGLVLLFGGYYFYHKEAQAPTVEVNQPNTGLNSVTPTPSASATLSASPTTAIDKSNAKGTAPNYSPGEPVGGAGTDGSDIQVLEVNYTDTGFSPSSTTIKANDYIFFTNKSSKSFWPIASAAGGYPGFNAGKLVPPGQKYKFQFSKKGTWHFEEKSDPSKTGIVIVK